MSIHPFYVSLKILTNHHCGRKYIQEHSAPEHDYLTDGFWAMNKTQELPNPNLTVKFLNRIEDVTDKVLGNVAENLSAARSRILDADIAMETSEMTRNSILQQAGVSILAQANQTPLLAVSLLG